jgi:hypothetical protein
MNKLTHLVAAAALALLTTSAALAQTGGVTIGASQAPDASAVLDIVSSAKGALLPRLTAAQRLGIATPAAGLIVFQTDAPTSGTGAGTRAGFWFNSGTGAAPAWQLLADNRAVSYTTGTGLGTGTGSTLSTTNPGTLNGGDAFPFRQDIYEDVKMQYLVRAAQLTAAGLTAGNLTSVALTVTNKASTKPYLGLTVQIGSTATATLSDFYTGTLTTVYTAPPTGYGTVAGTNAWPFAAPYFWDGTSNLVVQICYNNPAGYASGTGADVIASTSSGGNGQRVRASANGGAGCSLSSGIVDDITPVLTFGRSTAYTLPAVPGTAGQVLTQQANGNVSFADAPWTQAGNSVYATNLASNVGVGTTAPAQKLEVAGSVYTNAENAGVIVDVGGEARVGLLKYGGREAGLWRTTGQDFEIGRVSNGATAITALPDVPSTFTTDLYVGGSGAIGLGTATPYSQLANTGSNIISSNGQGGNPGSLAWSASQTGYVGLLYNGQAAAPGNGLAVKVAGTDAGSSVLDVSAGATQAVVGNSLLNVRASGAASIPGTLAVGTRLTTGPIVYSIQNLAMPTTATTITLTAALLKLTDNGVNAGSNISLGTTGVQEGQQVLVTNLDPNNVVVAYGAGNGITIGQYYTYHFVYTGGFWTREF